MKPTITRKQRVTLELLCRGCTQRQVAHREKITPQAINLRLRNAVRRLGAKNLPHAIAIATRAGLIVPSED